MEKSCKIWFCFVGLDQNLLAWLFVYFIPKFLPSIGSHVYWWSKYNIQVEIEIPQQLSSSWTVSKLLNFFHREVAFQLQFWEKEK